MINTIALTSLGDDWDPIKATDKAMSKEQLASIQQWAKNNNNDGRLDNAIKGLDSFNTTVVDSIRQFAVDNDFEYLGNIGYNYEKFGYAKTSDPASADAANIFNSVSTSGPYKDKMPAWMRGNSLASVQEYAVRGQIRDYQVLLFVDRVVAATGGNVNTDGNYDIHYSNGGIIAVKLHKIFPQLVLDSNKNDKFFLKTRSAAIDASQKLELEGNFGEYFDFYAPKGINANSLSVLAPNFMQMLIDSSATFDVEIFGEYMYITTHDPLFSASVMQEAVEALNVQLRYMNRLEQSWNYQPLVEPFDTLKQSKIVNLYSVKIGSHRIGLLQLIILGFILAFLSQAILPLIFILPAFL